MSTEAPEAGGGYETLDFAVRTSETADGAIVVVVSGDVDYTHSRELEAAIERRLADHEGPARLVVDLAAVPYCDSCGMRVLLGASQRVTGTGGTFGLRGLHGQPQRALRLTGLDRVLHEAGPAGELDARSHG